MVIQFPNHAAHIVPAHRQQNKKVSLYYAEYSIKHSEYNEHVALDLLAIC